MDKWDGQKFIDKMALNAEKSVLEIGVGTGRLAVRLAPLCKQFYGIDLSQKTVARAKENLSWCANTTLICGDFLTHQFDCTFDVIYSSLTFMHMKNKQQAVDKAAKLLNPHGKFFLSIDKNQTELLDAGAMKIRIYPDNPVQIQACIRTAGLTLIEHFETEFAHVFVAQSS